MPRNDDNNEQMLNPLADIRFDQDQVRHTQMPVIQDRVVSSNAAVVMRVPLVFNWPVDAARQAIWMVSMSRNCGRARRAYLIRVTGTSTRWITLVATEPIIKLAIGPRPRVPMMIASHFVSWTCRAISLAGEPTRERAWY